MRRAFEELLRPVDPRLLGARPGPDAVAAASAEVAARKELLALLADLERLAVPLDGGEVGVPGPAELLARIDEEVRATDIHPRDERRHVLHVVDVRDARAWEAELVVVLGCVEGELPRAVQDDLFLPEGTRRALSGRRAGRRGGQLRIRTAADRAAEERFLFYAAATRARRELWLLYPGFTPSGGTRRPSRFLDAVGELLTPEAWERAQVQRAPKDLVPDDPERLLTPTAVRRFAYRRAAAVSRASEEEGAKVQLALGVLRELLASGHELGRASVALKTPEPTLEAPLGAEAALGRVYSATELEAYAACPFRHFVQHVLGIRPDDDLAQSGLDARRQGMVVHSALEQVYSAGLSPEDAVDAAFREGAGELEIGMEEEAFRRQALQAVRAFVAEDDPTFRRATGLEPWAFEKAFGPRAPDGPLWVPAPDLGGDIQLQGAVDRIDVLPPPAEGAAGGRGDAATATDEGAASGRGDAAAEEGTATEAPRRAGFVTDYKLGGREVDGKYLDDMHKGERLQIPIYLLALARVFGIEPLGAAFAALGTRKRTGVVAPATGRAWEAPLADEGRIRLHRVPIDLVLERTEETVRRYVLGISQGIVDRLPREPAECERCDARDVCRLEPWEARRRARRGRALPLERAQAPQPAGAAPR